MIAKLYKNGYRIFLRSLKYDDYVNTHIWRSDEEYSNGVVNTKRFISVSTEKKWLQKVIQNHNNGKQVRLGITLVEGGELIGMIYLTQIDYNNRCASCGSVIGIKKFRKKGYVTEARKLLFNYTFNVLNLKRIEATILENNLASRKSVEKFGYKKEAIYRDAIYKNGEFHNLIGYSISREDFLSNHSNS